MSIKKDQAPEGLEGQHLEKRRKYKVQKWLIFLGHSPGALCVLRQLYILDLLVLFATVLFQQLGLSLKEKKHALKDYLK